MVTSFACLILKLRNQVIFGHIIFLFDVKVKKKKKHKLGFIIII